MTKKMLNFPTGTAAAVKLDRMLLLESKRPLSERLSSRLVQCASILEGGEFLGWQMIVPKKGLIGCTLFCTGSVSTDDLKWSAEKTGSIKPLSRPTASPAVTMLYELYLPVVNPETLRSTIGFGAAQSPHTDDSAEFPLCFSAQFEELTEALRTTGGVLRAVVGPADAASQQFCRKAVQKTFFSREIPVNDYIGTPVRMRLLLCLPGAPSLRLRTVLHAAIPEAKLSCLGSMAQADVAAVWDNPLHTAPTLPDYAARILMLEPELHHPIAGMNVSRAAASKIPASHRNVKDAHAVTIGKATDVAGTRRSITIGTIDLKRHYQIVGQTGTGKSTLLATTILSAIAQGHGLTFFDPHGSTIDTVLHALPEKYADRVRVVRIGDAENPVPLNLWDSDDPCKEERNIADLCELFGDIFNPPGMMFVGPRYERWLAAFAKASIALLGRRASLESIAVLSQSQENMEKLCSAIRSRYPEVAETIKQEYCLDSSRDFHNDLGWYLCKFQRLTSVEQLRKTLGAGANALDFSHSIDTDSVTLIDLAVPQIGTNAARIIGTMLMMKLWNAVLTRQQRDRTHLVVVDEAALFQTNPMPRMLAESRKFGVSMVLCHQHTGQLSDDIRDALEANSANFSAFRLSPKDAAKAAVRFDDPGLAVQLARLDAYQAVTTLSVDGRQTEPFTLETVRPAKQKHSDEIAAQVEAHSRETLVEPYREQRALTPAEILTYLDHPDRIMKPDWLLEWKKKRAAMQQPA